MMSCLIFSLPFALTLVNAASFSSRLRFFLLIVNAYLILIGIQRTVAGHGHSVSSEFFFFNKVLLFESNEIEKFNYFRYILL